MADRDQVRSKLGGVYSSRQMALKDKEHHAIMKKLRALPGNKHCAECQSSPTTWASVTLGVFVCMRCSQVHRSLGAHLSKVKSCMGTYTWYPDEIEAMRRMGNAHADTLFLGGARKGESIKKPTPDSAYEEIDAYSRDKYERRRWYLPGGPAAVEAAMRSRAAPASASTARRQQPSKAATAAAQSRRAAARAKVRGMRSPKPAAEAEWADFDAWEGDDAADAAKAAPSASTARAPAPLADWADFDAWGGDSAAAAPAAGVGLVRQRSAEERERAAKAQADRRFHEQKLAREQRELQATRSRIARMAVSAAAPAPTPATALSSTDLLDLFASPAQAAPTAAPAPPQAAATWPFQAQGFATQAQGFAPQGFAFGQSAYQAPPQPQPQFMHSQPYAQPAYWQ